MELPLLYKTIEEKREIQFGESYNFFLLVSSIVPKNSNVLFYTPSGEIYFSSRYFLFPRIVDFAKNEKDFSTLLLKGKYDYLIIFFTNDHSYDGATQYFPNLEKFKVIKSYVKKNEYTYKGAIIKL